MCCIYRFFKEVHHRYCTFVFLLLDVFIPGFISMDCDAFMVCGAAEASVLPAQQPSGHGLSAHGLSHGLSQDFVA